MIDSLAASLGLEGLAWSRPWVGYLALLLPLFAFVRRRMLRRSQVAFAPLQLRAPGGRAGWAKWEPVLEVLLISLLLVGLAGPHRVRSVELIEDEGIDLMMVLDVSLSMLAEDFPPNRLEVLRRLAEELVQRSGGHRIGVIIFAKDAYVQSPMTTDHRTLQELLKGVTVYSLSQTESGGTAVGDALLVAAERLRASRIEGRDQALVLITDGASNQGIDPVIAAQYLREQEVRLYSIGIGGEDPVEVTFEGRKVGGDTPYQALLDDTELRALTEAGQGRYWRATDVNALERVFEELARLESAPLAVRKLDSKQPVTAPIAVASLIVLALLLLLGTALRRPLA